MFFNVISLYLQVADHCRWQCLERSVENPMTGPETTKCVSKRHIAIFVPSLCGGGAERIMVILANGFTARGHRVDLVLTRAEGPYLSEVSDAVRIVNLNKGRVMASLLPLVRYLRRERPDAMLSALNHANIVAILARKMAHVRTRLVVSERNSLVALGHTGRGWVMRQLMRRTYPWADAIVAVSRAMALELVEEIALDPRKVTAIPNPVDVESIQRFARCRPDHPWLEPMQPPVILAVGRLEPQKDYATLLKAFAKLRAQRDVRLIILGEGSQRNELEQMIAELNLHDGVDLVGFKENPFRWMAACDLFVLSSRYEGFPNVLVQAMACGAPVVSTNCQTGPAEILEGGRLGRLVPVGNAAAMAKAMDDSLNCKKIPDVGMRANSFNSSEKIAQYLDQLLNEPLVP